MSTTQVPPLDQQQISERLLAIIRQLLTDAGRPQLASLVSPSAALEKDLGLKSFDLVELLLRTEAEFNVKLPDHIAEYAVTVADWARVVHEALQQEKVEDEQLFLLPDHPAALPAIPPRYLTEVLLQHAELNSDRVHALFVQSLAPDGPPHVQPVTYAQLALAAGYVASSLVELRLPPAAVVGLLLPEGPLWLAAYLGSLLAGLQPLVLPVPDHLLEHEEFLRTCAPLVAAHRPAALLVDPTTRDVARLLSLQLPGLRGCFDVAELQEAATRPSFGLRPVAPIAVAVLTRGVTRRPKPVSFTHSFLVERWQTGRQLLAIQPQDCICNWLPFSTHMGLIWFWGLAFFWGLPIIHLPKNRLAQYPEEWLLAIAKYGATIAGGLPWAYRLCARRVPAWMLEELSFSSWRQAWVFGDYIEPRILQEFSQRFARFGFNPDAFRILYNVAEAGGIALASHQPPRLRSFPSVRFFKGISRGTGSSLPICPLPSDQKFDLYGLDISFGFQTSLPQDDSPTPVARELELTPSDSTARKLRTGDLAFSSQGKIYVFCRSRELFSDDNNCFFIASHVERMLEKVPGIREGGVAIFQPGRKVTDRMVVAETSARLRKDVLRVRHLVQQLLQQVPGFSSARITLLSHRRLPRSPEGTLRRHQVQRLYRLGQLHDLKPTPVRMRPRLWLVSARGISSATSNRFATRLRSFFNDLARPILLSGQIIRLRLANSAEDRWQHIRQVAARYAQKPVARLEVHAEQAPPGPALIALGGQALDDLFGLVSVLEQPALLVDTRCFQHTDPLIQKVLGEFFYHARTQPEYSKLEAVILNAFQKGWNVVLLPEVSSTASPYRQRHRLGPFCVATRAGVPVWAGWLRHSEQAGNTVTALTKGHCTLEMTLVSANAHQCTPEELRRATHQTLVTLASTQQSGVNKTLLAQLREQTVDHQAASV